VTDTQTRHRLTDEQMANIRSNIETAVDMDALIGAFLIDVWKLLIGAEAWDALGPGELRVMDHALPATQSGEIMGWAMRRGDQLSQDPQAGPLVGLEWVNSGPSSYAD
jgi:hypothetical protein